MSNFFQKIIHFVNESIAELKKVSWLSKKEAVASTIVIIIFIILVAIFVSFTDFVLSHILAVLL